MYTLALNRLISSRWKLISTRTLFSDLNVRPISICKSHIGLLQNEQKCFSQHQSSFDRKLYKYKHFSHNFQAIGFHTSTLSYKNRTNKNEDKKKLEKEEDPFQNIPTILLLITSIFALLFFLNDRLKNNGLDELNEQLDISWDQFVNSVLITGEVKKIYIVTNNQHNAIVLLHPNANLDGKPARYKRIVNLKDNKQLENMLRAEESKLRIDPFQNIPVEYMNNNVPSIFLLGLGFLAITFFLARRMPSVMKEMDTFQTKMSEMNDQILTKKTGIKFRNVAGMHEAKQEVKEFVDFLKNSKKYTRLGAKLPKGCLLSGPPGVGKTLLAKALATEARVPFIPKAGSDFVELVGGLGAKRIRELFQKARQHSPCIVYIDELDAIGKERNRGVGGRMENANREADQTLNQILVEMDGMLSSQHQVIVLASTNRADLLDKALLRPGRFDRIIEIGLPNVKERMEILEVHLKNLKLDSHYVHFQSKLANLTPGMSGADLANICNEAAIYAARLNDSHVEEHHLDYAVERVIAGAPKSATSVSPEERRVVAVHESGHALIGWLLEHTDTLAKVTIIPRTKAALGFARTIPSDRYLHSPDQMFDNMCMLLGGRAAENLVFGRVTQGAQNDLEKVTGMANSQVKYFGFNEKIGNLSFPQDPNPVVKPYSQALAAIMDQEVNLLIRKAYAKTEEVLKNNRPLLDKLANELFTRESLGYDDIVNIIGPPKYSNKQQVIQIETGPTK